MMLYRYPGVKPFEIQESNLFFGRDKDIEQLYKFINNEKTVVLHSKSGFGKSSLINAGIIPKLKKQKNYIHFTFRFGNYSRENNQPPLQAVSNHLEEEQTNIELAEEFSIDKNKMKEKTFLDEIVEQDTSLWYYFKKIQVLLGGKKDFILIFDQFEEIFTYPDESLNHFKKELADLQNIEIPQHFVDALEQHPEVFENEEVASLLYKPLNIKILFAIRSDKMSHLNKMTDFFPGIMLHCYELAALTREQANDAIVKPAHDDSDDFATPTFEYTNEAIRKMLQFLTKGNEKNVESFQLQILCQHVERNIINNDKRQVYAGDLGNIEDIYENYYDNLLMQLTTDETEYRDARILIEEQLILEDEERRLSIDSGQIDNTKVSQKLLDKLVDSHLLRREPNTTGGVSYELSHDTLVNPILKSKKVRLEEERRQAEKERQKLELIALQKKQEEELAERKRQEQIREQRRQLSEQKKKAKANRRIISIITIAIIITTALAIYAYFKKEDEEKQRIKAQRAQQKANTLQHEAEQQAKEASEYAQEADSLKKIAYQKAEALEKEKQKALENARILQQQKSELEQKTNQLKEQKKLNEKFIQDLEEKANELDRQKQKAENYAKRLKEQVKQYEKIIEDLTVRHNQMQMQQQQMQQKIEENVPEKEDNE